MPPLLELDELLLDELLLEELLLEELDELPAQALPTQTVTLRTTCGPPDWLHVRDTVNSLDSGPTTSEPLKPTDPDSEPPDIVQELALLTLQETVVEPPVCTLAGSADKSMLGNVEPEPELSLNKKTFSLVRLTPI